MTIDRNKYIVWKREDWNQFATGMGEDGVHQGGNGGIYITDFAERCLTDAVIIRKKDTFAASALYGYATAVQNAIEIMEDHGLNGEQLKTLRELADFFAGEADEARAIKGKLPD